MNRHSTGHFILKHLVEYFSAKQLVRRGDYSVTRTNDYSIVLVKSNTYMNESGRGFRQFVDNEDFQPSQSIVVILYDDFDNKLGKVKLSELKKNESHNGIRDISRALHGIKSDVKIYKLGIGIGPKPSKASGAIVSNWVLSKFTDEELTILRGTSFNLVTKYVDEIYENNAVGDCNLLNQKIAQALP
ncbi:hypothetical protein G9P44_003504 [Scheffersomyces stipitis]|nr:hypothetical protein G9P44_003504 [Scheffersomyces stipitis]